MQYGTPADTLEASTTMSLANGVPKDEFTPLYSASIRRLWRCASPSVIIPASSMTSGKFTESTVEEANLEWLQALGYALLSGPAIEPDEPGAERTSFEQVI